MIEEPIRVLVVDDNPEDYQILKVLFSKVKKGRYDLWNSPSLEKALEELSFQRHDVYLVDYRLGPDLGLDFLRKAAEIGCRAPVIVLTGQGDHELDLEAMTLGAADFLNKNKVEPDLLERSVRYAVERARSQKALRDNEQFFRAVIENALDGVAILDTQGNVRYVSPSVEKMLGFTPQEVIEKGYVGLLESDERRTLEQAVQYLSRAPGNVQTLELLVRHKNGQMLTIECTAKSHLFEGSAMNLIVNFQDITERKKAERTTSRLASIVESSEDAIYTLTLDGIVLSWNPGAQKIYGFAPEEIGGRDIAMALPPGGRDEFHKLLETVRDGRPVANFSTRHRTRDGREILLSLTLSPIRNNLGQVSNASVIARDITEAERARTVRNILQAERDRLLERLQLQMERMPIACLLADRDFNYTYWNPAAEKMFGYAFSEVEGRHPNDAIVPPQSRVYVQSIFERIARGDMTAQGVFSENTRKDGSVITCEWYNTPLYDAEGEFNGIMSMALDITERKKSENAVAQSEERFRKIFQDSPMSMALVASDGKILMPNPRLCQFTGYSAEELAAMTFSKITHPEDLEKDLSQYQDLVAGKVSGYEMDKRYVRKDGKTVWGHLTVTLIRDQAGQPLYSLGMVADITESRKAQEVQKRLVSILENTREGIINSDLNSNIIDWNRGAEEIYGYKAGEIVGRSSRILEPPDRQGEIDAYSQELLAGGDFQSYETVRRRKDGRLIHVAVTRTPLKDDQGCIVGFSSIMRDVTERKKAEEIQSQLAAILQQTSDAVLGFDLEGHFFSWNRGASDLFGYSLDEIVGRPFAFLMPQEREEEARSTLKEALEGESISNHETVWLKKGGEAVDVSVSLSQIKDPKGKVVGVSAIARDITERKRAEQAFRHHEEQLRLAQKMDAIGRLAGGVAHDFNNLLSVIGGNVEFMLSMLPADNPQREEAEEIQKAVRHGAELTKQLLVFGQRQVSKPEPVNLNALSSEMNKMFKRLIPANIDLGIIQDRDLGLILADQGQMQQVILNLVLNARDAMPNGGHLIIETRNVKEGDLPAEQKSSMPPGDYVRLMVTDTGTGMDPETQKRIFEPFFTTKADKGTGLGLASVYGIVQKWNGHIFVHSTLGMGTHFALYFPILKDVKAQAAKPSQLNLVLHGNETVLLVEDEDPLRRVLVRTLKRYGYNVLEAANGLEALEKAMDFKEPIDLLVTDTIMPKMNGKEVADELRKKRPKTRVIFISGYTQEVLSQQGILEPGITLLQKPFAQEDLVGHMRRILDEK